MWLPVLAISRVFIRTKPQVYSVLMTLDILFRSRLAQWNSNNHPILLRFRCTTENKLGLERKEESKYSTQSYLLFYQPHEAGEANSKTLISSGTNYKLAILCSNETICAIWCASKIPNLKPIEWLTAACPSPIGNVTQPNQQCFQVLETEGIKWKSDPNMLHSKIKFNLHSSEKAFPYHQKCSSCQ